MNKSETIKDIVIGVDIQNDFIDGSLAVPDGKNVVEPMNRAVQTVRKIGGAVVFTRDWHPASTPHFDTWPVHCVAETQGAAFHPDLDIQPTDTIISKGTGLADGYSGWEGTSDDGQTIETIVASAQTEKVRVFIGGLATDYCVKATAVDVARNFADNDRVTTYLLRDAVRGVEINVGDTAAALDEIDTAGVTQITTDEMIALLQNEA